MKKFGSIDIIFENCECVNIPRDAIFYFTFDNITRGMMWSSHNDEIEYQTADDIAIVLNPEADVEYAPFGIDDLKDSIFNRILLHDDITSIGINYEDEDTEFIDVYWKSKNELDIDNECQKSYRLDDKLRIEIRRK